MISRRLLRIKALLILYAYNRKNEGNPGAAEKELLLSLKMSYHLYHLLLMLIIDIIDIAAEKIDIARQKKIPTEEDLNPNTKLIENRMVKQLEANKQLKTYSKKEGVNWSEYPEIPRMYYRLLTESDMYKDYMNSGNSSYAEDKKFVSHLLDLILEESEELLSVLEEKSVYWNDDLDFVSIMVDKTLRKFRDTTGENHRLMPLYRSEEDEDFVKRLLLKTILNTDELTGMIDRNTTNWEIERIALMDTLVMQMAITEIKEFPEIPVKVSLNEYIEIAKFYCTSKSSTFVNGILDKIVREMRAEQMFSKKGRGLVGETGNDNIEKKDKS